MFESWGYLMSEREDYWRAAATPSGIRMIAGSSLIGHGKKNVTTAGTDVQLASSTPCSEVTIMANISNTGYIAVGSSGVDATLSNGDGILLAAGDTFSVAVSDLSHVYIDSTVSGEGVRFTYVA